MKKLVLSAVFSCTLASFTHAQTTQIVDNQDSGFSITAGTWTPSTFIAGFIGDNYLNTGDTTLFNQVQWQLSTSTGTNYDVAARWTAFGNRTTSATYSITHANGVSQVTVNQQQNGGEFVSLGVFESPTLVQLSNDGINGFVVADAIQFQPTTDEAAGSGSVDLEACYGDEYFDDGNGLVKYDPAVHTEIDSSTQFVYKGTTQLIPNFTVSIRRSMGVYVRNLSNSTINIFYEGNFYSNLTGVRVSYPIRLDGAFTDSNSPLSISGGNLPADSFGSIIQGFVNQTAVTDGELYWTSNQCLVSAPILATIEVTGLESGQIRASSSYPLNNGQPW